MMCFITSCKRMSFRTDLWASVAMMRGSHALCYCVVLVLAADHVVAQVTTTTTTTDWNATIVTDTSSNATDSTESYTGTIDSTDMTTLSVSASSETRVGSYTATIVLTTSETSDGGTPGPATHPPTPISPPTPMSTPTPPSGGGVRWCTAAGNTCQMHGDPFATCDDNTATCRCSTGFQHVISSSNNIAFLCYPETREVEGLLAVSLEFTYATAVCDAATVEKLQVIERAALTLLPGRYVSFASTCGSIHTVHTIAMDSKEVMDLLPQNQAVEALVNGAVQKDAELAQKVGTGRLTTTVQDAHRPERSCRQDEKGVALSHAFQTAGGVVCKVVACEVGYALTDDKCVPVVQDDDDDSMSPALIVLLVFAVICCVLAVALSAVYVCRAKGGADTYKGQSIDSPQTVTDSSMSPAEHERRMEKDMELQTAYGGSQWQSECMEEISHNPIDTAFPSLQTPPQQVGPAEHSPVVTVSPA